MKLVRDEIFELLAARGVTHIFGNPGSTEMSLLAGLPAEIKYTLCLHEAVAVAAAIGYAKVARRPSLANLHAYPGVCNAMGAIASAKATAAPVVLVAGQQDSRHLRFDPLLSGPIAETVRPVVKWSKEPQRAADVGPTLERAFRVATSPPMGPVLVSIPMDFLEGQGGITVPMAPRIFGAFPAEDVEELADELRAARSPALITGGGVEASGAWYSAQQIAEALGASVYADPFAVQLGFPTSHHLYRGALPPDARGIRESLASHDVVLAIGLPAFILYPYTEGGYVPEGTSLHLLTDDPMNAARIEGGTSYIVDLGQVLPQLASALSDLLDRAKSAGKAPSNHHQNGDDLPKRNSEGAGISLQLAVRAIDRHRSPEGIILDESISAGAVVRRTLSIGMPNSYVRTSSGVLGFALPGAIGAQIAEPNREVMVVIGDGTVMYTPQALWTMVDEKLPIKVVVLNNGGYRILEQFHNKASRHLGPAPSLDNGHLRLAELAVAQGMRAVVIEQADLLDEQLKDAFASPYPCLIDIRLESD